MDAVQEVGVIWGVFGGRHRAPGPGPDRQVRPTAGRRGSRGDVCERERERGRKKRGMKAKERIRARRTERKRKERTHERKRKKGDV